MQDRPRADGGELVSEWVGDELVIYDPRTELAHALSPDAAAVWERCDGQRTPSQLASELKLTPTLVEQALAELYESGLLEQPAPDGVSRRTVLRRTAKAGGAALIAAPLISTVLIPPATAFASSTCPPTTFGNECELLWSAGRCTGSIVLDTCTHTFGCTCQNLGPCGGVGAIQIGTCG
jgi:DNA-binding transcriptional ArsR family regulator